MTARCLALCLALAFLSGCGGAEGERATEGDRDREPAAKRSPRSVALPRGWSRLARPPVARFEAATVWGDRELLVWGGNTASDAVHDADGRSYDAATDRWDALPPAPLAERSSAAITWTGSEATVWTGREVVVWGAKGRASPRSDGAAYDPASDTWRRIRDAPFALNEASAAWTGEEIVVVGALLDGFNDSASEHARALAYRPETDTWRVLPDTPLSPQAVSAAWTGSDVVAWDYVLDAAAYEPGDDAWRRLPRLPLDEMEAQPESAVVARALFAWYSGQAAVLDMRTETWTRLPVPPAARGALLVPAEGAVLLLAPTTLHAFRP